MFKHQSLITIKMKLFQYVIKLFKSFLISYYFYKKRCQILYKLRLYLQVISLRKYHLIIEKFCKIVIKKIIQIEQVLINIINYQDQIIEQILLCYIQALQETDDENLKTQRIKFLYQYKLILITIDINQKLKIVHFIDKQLLRDIQKIQKYIQYQRYKRIYLAKILQQEKIWRDYRIVD
ncbi:unnamed protein product [Paramecium sonneborni]|uniref:Transmembrane protein n=1 Tax=Paramecium sonneborni TaxID=65129 RepID=A0A8S1RPJ6_9CILI|nr:unnamed protein product [Paramecium sonneborni]